MNLEDFQDFIVYSVQHDAYAYWGRTQEGPLGWCLVKPDAHGYPLTKSEAEALAVELKGKWGGDWEVRARQKSPAVCIKAV